MKRKIWLSQPHLGDKELELVQDAFASNWIAPLGPFVNEFEQNIENYLGHGVHAAALSSGTAAIHLALVMLGIGSGDEVLCQSLTFAASANPILYQGARPIFVDSEPETWNMSPEFLEEAIVDRLKIGKKPKAVIIVHLYGMPAKLDELMDVASKYDIPVIEDAAEALGSEYKGRAVGTFGKLAILSFNGNKIITTSGGGAIISAEEEYVRQAKFLSTQALDAAPHYQHSQIGYNYRLSNVCAAIGVGQMKVLDDRVKSRRMNFELYKEKLNHLGFHFQAEPRGFFSNRWLTTLLIDNQRFTREDVRLALREENIDSRPVWKPMHLQPLYTNFPFYGNGTSDLLFEKGLCLPSGSNLLEEDLSRICHIICSIPEKNSTGVSSVRS